MVLREKGRGESWEYSRDGVSLGRDLLCFLSDTLEGSAVVSTTYFTRFCSPLLGEYSTNRRVVGVLLLWASLLPILLFSAAPKIVVYVCVPPPVLAGSHAELASASSLFRVTTFGPSSVT